MRIRSHVFALFSAVLAWLVQLHDVIAQPNTDRFGDVLPPGAVARLGANRFRHQYRIDDIAFAPDSKSLASIDASSGITVWQVPGGRELFRKAGMEWATGDWDIDYQEGTRQIAFEKNGKSILYTARFELHHWLPGEIAKRPANKYQSSDPRPQSRISPGGKYVALFRSRDQKSRTNVRLVDANENHLESFELDGIRSLSAAQVAFSADEKRVAMPAGNDEILVYDIAREKEQYVKGLRGTCTALSFAPDGTTLMTASECVQVWDIPSGKLARTIESLPRNIQRLAFAPDGKHFIAQNESEITSINAETFTSNWSAPYKAGVFAFSPDGKYVAVVQQKKIRLLDAATGRSLNPDIDTDIGRLVGFTSNGRAALFSVQTKSEQFESWTLLRGVHAGRVQNPLAQWDVVAQSADRTRAVTQDRIKDGNANLMTVRNSKSGKIEYDLPQAERAIVGSPSERMFAIANSGQRFAFAGDGRVKLWHLDRNAKTPAWSIGPTMKKGDELENLRNSLIEPQVTKVAFSPNGRTFMVQKGFGRHSMAPTHRFAKRSYHSGNVLSLYDVESGVERATLHEAMEANTPNYAVTWWWSEFSPDSRLLTCKSDSYGVQIWNLRFEQLSATIAKDGYADHCLFAPDSRSVAIAEDSGRISIWECATGGLRTRWQAHQGQIQSLLFSPDGRYLVSQGPEGAALVWDIHAVRDEPPWKRPTFAQLWLDLGDPEARRASQVSAILFTQPKEAVVLMRHRLKPAPRVGDKQIQAWIADLSSEHFATRDKAMRSLQEHVEQAFDALKVARRQPAPLETVRRLGQLLEAASKTEMEVNRLRAGRAIELLEHFECQEAEELLRELAKGDHQALVTNYAREALERIERRRE